MKYIYGTLVLINGFFIGGYLAMITIINEVKPAQFNDVFTVSAQVEPVKLVGALQQGSSTYFEQYTIDAAKLQPASL